MNTCVGHISIHSPRMGRDDLVTFFANSVPIFQSTLPAWGETGLLQYFEVLDKFQSTLPAWGETVILAFVIFLCFISIHSPRMGRDEKIQRLRNEWHVFQSTLPAWGETSRILKSHFSLEFQSTLPAWGETIN